MADDSERGRPPQAIIAIRVASALREIVQDFGYIVLIVPPSGGQPAFASNVENSAARVAILQSGLKLHTDFGKNPRIMSELHQDPANDDKPN